MSNIFSLANKLIVVTGGTGVLGGTFVDGLIEAGAQLVILGRNERRGAQQVAQSGGKAVFMKGDVTNEEQLTAVRAKIIQSYGRIDGLVNAAGGNVPEGILSSEQDVFAMDIGGMQKALALNLWGTVIPNQVFGVELAKTGGAIVNISSVSSKRPLSRVLGYGMGKAALDLYTKWMAIEIANRYGDAIRINSLAPGFFLSSQNKSLLTNPDGSWTERAEQILRQTPFSRFGEPEELVGALVWLLSDAARFVTGMDIIVDGGFTINSGV